MIIKDRCLTFTPAFNIGIGYTTNVVSVKGQCKFKSEIYMLPFLAITYTKVYVA